MGLYERDSIQLPLNLCFIFHLSIVLVWHDGELVVEPLKFNLFSVSRLGGSVLRCSDQRGGGGGGGGGGGEGLQCLGMEDGKK